ncbi:hypothetical protein ACFX13_029596 [Malus domestica]
MPSIGGDLTHRCNLPLNTLESTIEASEAALIVAVNFLYPSEEGSYKLIRFLVERLSDSSEVGGKAGPEGDNDERKEKEGSSGSNLEDQTTVDEEPDLSRDKVRVKLDKLTLKSQVPEISVNDVYTSSTGRFNKDRQTNVFSGNHLT